MRNAAAVDQHQGRDLAQAAHAHTRGTRGEAAGAAARRIDRGADGGRGTQDAQRRGLAGALDVIAGQHLQCASCFSFGALDAAAGDFDALQLFYRCGSFLCHSVLGEGQCQCYCKGAFLQTGGIAHHCTFQNYSSNIVFVL
ncbi:hypothetical protein D3C81_1809840 [compost metagenome]